LHAAPILTEHYESLRSYVLARNSSSGLRLGMGALMSRGMAAWMQVAGELMASARSFPLRSTETASVPQSVLDEVIQLMGSAVMTLVSGGSL
jgi:glycine/serine hydroxymethyltransferase